MSEPELFKSGLTISLSYGEGKVVSSDSDLQDGHKTLTDAQFIDKYVWPMISVLREALRHK